MINLSLPQLQDIRLTELLRELLRRAIDGTVVPLFVDTKNQKVAVGTTTPNASALLDLTSTTMGFAPPRMTTTQKNAISSPATGLEVFDTTLGAPQTYDGTAWVGYGTAGGGDIVARMLSMLATP